VLGLLACVYLFVVGIGAMGQAFKLFGDDFSKRILGATASPFIGLFVGILSTALVQSSSTTTSVVVGMVAAGVVTIDGAIPIIMGANVGTTVTNTLVSLGHAGRSVEFKRAFAAATVHDFFNWMAIAVLFPMELATGFLAKASIALTDVVQNLGGAKLGSPVKVLTDPAIRLLSDLLGNVPGAVLMAALLLIFCALLLIVKLLRSLVLAKIEAFFDEHLFRNPARAMLFGTVLTVAVQSSSITTSLVVPLAAAGVLKLRQIFPFTLGTNVGTTVTAILAAIATGRGEAITVSLAHLLFNVSGIVLIWPLEVVRQTPVRCAEWLAETVSRNRMTSLGLVGSVYFILPLLLILLFGTDPAEVPPGG
jgi:sodium-dependent phosphate cotransporter